jgi:hypothetical protein
MTLTIQVLFGAAQTGVGYRFFDSTGALLGSRVTSGITSLPETGGYIATATLPSGAVGVFWDSTETPAGASEDLREAIAAATIQGQTDLIPADPATETSIAALNDITVGDIRTELSTELGRIDAAISTRATDSGTATAVWAAGTRTLTSFGSLITDIWSAATRTLSAFAFTPTPSNAADVTAIKAKTDNLPASPANEATLTTINSKIGTPAVTLAADIAAIEGLPSETITALNEADQIILAEPYVPTEQPSVVVPAPSEDASLTVVYLYTEDILGAKRAGINVTLRLISTPTKGNRVLETTAKSDVTDSEGYFEMEVRQGFRYRAVCEDVDLDAPFTASGETFDLSRLIPNP